MFFTIPKNTGVCFMCCVCWSCPSGRDCWGKAKQFAPQDVTLVDGRTPLKKQKKTEGVSPPSVEIVGGVGRICFTPLDVVTLEESGSLTKGRKKKGASVAPAARKKVGRPRCDPKLKKDANYWVESKEG